MKKTLLTLMASLLLGGAAVAQHYTAPNAHSKSSNTPIVAAVTVDGAAAATGAELAVYVDDELRGLATTDQLVDGKFWVQVYYNTEKPSDTDPTTNVPNIEDLTFKLWDPTGEGTELTDYTLTYDNNGTTLTALTTSEEGWGTPGNPVAIDFAATQMQSMTFTQGWSWWSTYIELSDNGLSLLEEALGTNGLLIKARDKYVEYIPEDEMWWGDDDMVVCNENCYEISVAANHNASIRGRVANPSDHPITISQGWNWIGYPVSTPIAIDDAFASITPTEDDIIKDRSGFSQYIPGEGFWGDIEYMTPCQGYKYQALGSGSQTLTYPSGNRLSQGNPKNVKNEPIQESFEHRYLMNIIAAAEIDGKELTDVNYEIQAIANGNTRGHASLRYCEPTGKYVAMLTIYGDANEKLHFVVNNTETGDSFSVDESLSFHSDDVLGTLRSPFTFHANSSDDMVCLKDIFPNPAKTNGEVYLDLSKTINQEETLQVELYNALGEKVYSNSCSTIPVSFKAPATSGVYVVQLTTKNGKVYHGNLIVTK